MSEWEIAACFLAAHAHDVGHPGTNNRYQVAAKTPLGQKYGADATLEAYSADLGQQLLDEYGILSKISPQDRLAVLSTFRSSILGTDMAQHHVTCQALRHLPDDFYSQNYPQNAQGGLATGIVPMPCRYPALLLHARRHLRTISPGLNHLAHTIPSSHKRVCLSRRLREKKPSSCNRSVR